MFVQRSKGSGYSCIDASVTCFSPLHKKHLLRLTTDEKMHCRPTLGPRCMDLLVITADEFVSAAIAIDALHDPEDSLQLRLVATAAGAPRHHAIEPIAEPMDEPKLVVPLL